MEIVYMACMRAQIIDCCSMKKKTNWAQQNSDHFLSNKWHKISGLNNKLTEEEREKKNHSAFITRFFYRSVSMDTFSRSIDFVISNELCLEFLSKQNKKTNFFGKILLFLYKKSLWKTISFPIAKRAPIIINESSIAILKMRPVMRVPQRIVSFVAHVPLYLGMCCRNDAHFSP